MVRCRLLLLGILVALVAFCFAQPAFGQITQREEVIALRAVRRQLKDPRNRLRNWRKGDPCTSNWTGVVCYFNPNDGYLHVQELRLIRRNLSGNLAPELGRLAHMTILDFMFNNISGSIPKEIGNMTSLNLLLLSGNQISGPLPDELGYLPNITSHMNNNSISGQIPPELHKLPQLVHLQVDNNNFEGTEIPQSYTNMSNLLKLSLRNCKLQGTVPDFGTIPKLLYLDLSHNKLNGTIPTNRLYTGITTILIEFQCRSLENNFLSGDVPTDIWQNRTFASVARLVLNFRSNALTDLAGSLNPPSNVTIMLEGNPICRRANELNIANSCGNQTDTGESPPRSSNNTCPSAYLCPVSGGYELVPDTPVGCNCSAPVRVGFLLRSPSISDFPPYFDMFRHYITSNLHLDLYQLQISTPFIWEEGPRLRLFLKFHPHYTEDHFNETALQDLVNKIATYSIPGNDTFGPYDLLNFTFRGPYEYYDMIPTSSSMNKGVLAAIVLGSIACGGIIIMAMAFVFYTIRRKKQQDQDREKQTVPKIPMKIDGIKGFSFKELEEAASNFEITSQIGQGGYGKVYKGTLADGSVVAIKRAQRGSLQGQKEFFTEIELLSRLHHRNLVSLIGYCDEQSEQMLVYEFMANGSLHDLLSGNDDAARHGSPLNFVARLRTALGAAKGILYLHTEADPPIIHRDIKANNILLDSKFNAKVSDFGISRLFPEADADASVSAHVFTYVKGTPGYVDPEYFQTHKLTEKSDVYSLGIVFLELLTGMRPIYHGKHIVQEVLVACRAGLMFSTIDRRMGPYPADRVKKFMAMALKCCEEEGKDRPTMLEVVRELENITVTLPQSDTVTPESDTSSSATSGSILSSIYGRDSYTSSNFQGSDLVSGVIPTIRPR
ncbi:hypothetical protein CDL15_Pgr007637 [Punica granatum]|uniref:non-specific serine/threonine protein kinase n=1 Tax=Punica granatum TaxID=22663 RepID=A0A218XA76_PUNGR|nr:hypothetical protein CDL15_Pgr007637 [Punica granatum]